MLKVALVPWTPNFIHSRRSAARFIVGSGRRRLSVKVRLTCSRQWLALRKTALDGMPCDDHGFAELPAEKDHVIIVNLANFPPFIDAIGGVESVVATGGALLANRAWLQVLADVLGKPVEVSGVAEGSARGAVLTRLGIDAPAPVADVVEPRPDRHEIHRVAMQVMEDMVDNA